MSLLIETLAIEIGKKLKKDNLRLATVESCTGGGLSYWVTTVPGSSAWFERGFVTYTKEAKIDLGVSALTIEKFGEVSESTVKEMAEKGLQNSRANICIAITGIAGPSGGSNQKPVGTVWIAWARQGSPTSADSYLFFGDRQKIRMQAMEAALKKQMTM